MHVNIEQLWEQLYLNAIKLRSTVGQSTMNSRYKTPLGTNRRFLLTRGFLYRDLFPIQILPGPEHCFLYRGISYSESSLYLHINCMWYSDKWTSYINDFWVFGNIKHWAALEELGCKERALYPSRSRVGLYPEGSAWPYTWRGIIPEICARFVNIQTFSLVLL